jgi:hypothetical protein
MESRWLAIAFLAGAALAAAATFPPTQNKTGNGWIYYCEGNCSTDAVPVKASDSSR